MALKTAEKHLEQKMNTKNRSTNLEKIEKSDQEWQAQLTPEQYYVTRQHGTERPFTGEYLETSEPGIYHCICCDAALFYSEQKFESHCGWPSFDTCSDDAINYIKDETHGMSRVEIQCAKCDGHLGHIFNDGPTATGQRFCVNSLSLNFKPAT